MLKLFNSLVLPKMDYCSQMWAPHQNRDWSALEGIQRRFTSKINEVKLLDYWSRLQNLRLYSIERRFERYQVIYVWKILEGHAPNLRINKIKSKQSDRRGNSCILPTLKHKNCSAKVKSIRENSFSIHAPRLFNMMPKSIRDITGVKVDSFKLHLDRFLSKIPDQPSVTGYAGYRAAATNSLIHQIQRIGGGTAGADL